MQNIPVELVRICRFEWCWPSETNPTDHKYQQPKHNGWYIQLPLDKVVVERLDENNYEKEDQVHHGKQYDCQEHLCEILS